MSALTEFCGPKANSPRQILGGGPQFVRVAFWGHHSALLKTIRIAPSSISRGWQRMKLQTYGEVRYVACKNVDCSESIPLPDQSLLEPTAYQLTKGAVFPPVFLACMQCGHVYEYIPSEVVCWCGRYAGPRSRKGTSPRSNRTAVRVRLQSSSNHSRPNIRRRR